MTDKRKLTFDELVNAPVQVSLINEPIDYSVDFVVKETAEQRARRKWGMKEEPTQ